MNAFAECEMIGRVAPDIEGIGILELSWIVICRRENDERQLVSISFSSLLSAY